MTRENDMRWIPFGRHCAKGALLAASLFLLPSALAQEIPERRVYDDFSAFCLDHFRAEKEPLIYDKFGKDLRTLEDGT